MKNSAYVAIKVHKMYVNFDLEYFNCLELKNFH